MTNNLNELKKLNKWIESLIKATEEKQESLAIVLVDESGSMTGQSSKTREAVNGYIENLSPGTKVSLMTFDTHPGSKMVRLLTNAEPKETAKGLSKDNYKPNGSTPLLDAVGYAINHGDSFKKEHPNARITLVIQTDGEENSSVEYRLPTIRSMIESRTKEDWQVIFLGADLKEQAYTAAASMGIHRGATMSYGQGFVGDTFAAAASFTNSYSSVGSKVNISDKMKASLGDTTVKVEDEKK